MKITILLNCNEVGDSPICITEEEATDFVLDTFGVSVLNGESILVDELAVGKINSILILDRKEDDSKDKFKIWQLRS